MNTNTCKIGISIRWLHNADMLKLQEKQAELNMKMKRVENEKRQLERITKLHKQAREELDKKQNQATISVG